MLKVNDRNLIHFGHGFSEFSEMLYMYMHLS